MAGENLDLEGLRRQYTSAVLDDIARNPHNVGAKEVRELVALARVGLRAERVARAVRAVAWNERDGKCWCPRSPERDDLIAGGPAQLMHEPECLALRAALADAPADEADEGDRG